MDKIRSFSTKFGLSNLTSGSSTKLSKAFRFDKQHNAMSAQRSGDPFRDGPIFEEVSAEPLSNEQRIWGRGLSDGGWGPRSEAVHFAEATLDGVLIVAQHRQDTPVHTYRCGECFNRTVNDPLLVGGALCAWIRRILAAQTVSQAQALT